MNQLSIKKMNEISKKKKKGFTLVELIIVIAIIAILAAMAIPKLSSVRVDAKVSNDVAAAKNIATQVATGIANGSIDLSAGAIAAKDVDADILAKLDGKARDGKSEAIPASKFQYAVDAKGGVTVSVGTSELYPDNTGAGRKAHAIAAAK